MTRTHAWNYGRLAEAAEVHAEYADTEAERRVWLAVAERDRECAEMLASVAEPVLALENAA